MNLQRAVAGYWLDKRRALSVHTTSEYEHVFSCLLDYLGPEAEMKAISSDDIRRFLTAMRERRGLGAKTIINYQIALSSLWTWAARELGVTQVVKQVSRPRWNAPAIEPLTKTEIVAVLGACDTTASWETRNGRRAVAGPRSSGMRDRAIILTLLDSGVRASELTGFQLRDYDERAGRLHIRHGKGDKSRHVFLGASSQKAIWRYLSVRPQLPDSAPLFATRTGTALTTDNLRHMVERCAERAGIERHIHPHMFRHTFAINFLRNGGNVLELQSMLGHSNLETVKIYAKLAQVDLREAQRRASPADNWRL